MAFKIYTKTGDKGTTGLYGGKRVSKNNIRIEAYGTVDELNALIGHLADTIDYQDLVAELRLIQHDLFLLGSHLATDPEKPMQLPPLPEFRIGDMERGIDIWEEALPPLKNFILPGGHPVVSLTHWTRCICRRAERNIVALSQHSPVDNIIIQYFNRLSDYLFVLARFLSFRLGVEEIKWIPAIP